MAAISCRFVAYKNRVHRYHIPFCDIMVVHKLVEIKIWERWNQWELIKNELWKCPLVVGRSIQTAPQAFKWPWISTIFLVYWNNILFHWTSCGPLLKSLLQALWNDYFDTCVDLHSWIYPGLVLIGRLLSSPLFILVAKGSYIIELEMKFMRRPIPFISIRIIRVPIKPDKWEWTWTTLNRTQNKST